MEDNKNITLSSVDILDGNELNIDSLELLFDGNLSDKKISSIKDKLVKQENHFYLVALKEQRDKFLGYVIKSPYDRIANCQEISVNIKEQGDSQLFSEVMRYFISELSQDPNVEYICTKAETKNQELVNDLESLGFMKDGLYISNQFKNGEFIYYTVYKYKLI